MTSRTHDRLAIPAGIRSFEEFRRWALSDDFPETGRYDFLRGRIVADSEPEPLFSHNLIKGEIAATLMGWTDDGDLVTMTRGRVTMPGCELSVQPDISVTRWQSFETGRVMLTPHPNRPDDVIEVIGPPDLIVEIVSNESVKRDTVDLFDLYLQAGVQEYWILDVRGDETMFHLLTADLAKWREAAADSDGFRLSCLLGQRFRLDRVADQYGMRMFDLIKAQ